MPFQDPWREDCPLVHHVCIGGLPIACLGMRETVDLMVAAIRSRPRGRRPFYMTSANGEVISKTNLNPTLADLMDEADIINADGQPLVIASKFFCDEPLPERVATTDLFHVAAEKAEKENLSFYIFGATEEENKQAVHAVRKLYPNLNIVGHSHGYHRGDQLRSKIKEINATEADILWLSLGFPQEQKFVHEWSSSLPNIAIIKTSGGLLNFLSGKNRRAPQWMQKYALEWLYRLLLEPKRLAWRYIITNPLALFFLIIRSKS